ncbi:MAG: hypothetical protein NTX61_00555 [Bacteroidetes bacterium]|nr:hypothetical protein [Bacteroidota bacterium]
MPLNKGKHIVAEIEGVRCTVVETGLSESRALFLKELLTSNEYEVRLEKEKAKDGALLETYILGVTDLLFNPVIAVYMHKLKRDDGHEVTPAFWNQWPTDQDITYWMVAR